MLVLVYLPEGRIMQIKWTNLIRYEPPGSDRELQEIGR